MPPLIPEFQEFQFHCQYCQNRFGADTRDAALKEVLQHEEVCVRNPGVKAAKAKEAAGESRRYNS